MQTIQIWKLLMPLLWPLFKVVCAIAIVGLLLRFVADLLTGSLRPFGGRRKIARSDKGVAAVYFGCDLLSRGERAFFLALHAAAAGRCHIFAKVRLADIAKAADQSGFNRINCKHVDFLLCDTEGLEPFLASELDDRSHQNEFVRNKDAFEDNFFGQIRLPLKRIPAQRDYDMIELRRLIENRRGS